MGWNITINGRRVSNNVNRIDIIGNKVVYAGKDTPEAAERFEKLSRVAQHKDEIRAAAQKFTTASVVRDIFNNRNVEVKRKIQKLDHINEIKEAPNEWSCK